MLLGFLAHNFMVESKVVPDWRMVKTSWVIWIRIALLHLPWSFFTKMTITFDQGCSAGSKIQGVQLNFSGPFLKGPEKLQTLNLRGPKFWMLPTWRRFLGFLCHNLLILKSFCIDNDNFWCDQLGKGFRHFMSRKIQGVHEILIGPVGQFQSVTKGVQTVQRGPRTCRRARMRPLLLTSNMEWWDQLMFFKAKRYF